MIEFRYVTMNRSTPKLQWRFTCKVIEHMSGDIFFRKLMKGDIESQWNDIPAVNYIATEQPAPEKKSACQHVWRSNEHCWLICEKCGAGREV